MSKQTEQNESVISMFERLRKESTRLYGQLRLHGVEIPDETDLRTNTDGSRESIVSALERLEGHVPFLSAQLTDAKAGRLKPTADAPSQAAVTSPPKAAPAPTTESKGQSTPELRRLELSMLSVVEKTELAGGWLTPKTARALVAARVAAPRNVTEQCLARKLLAAAANPTPLVPKEHEDGSPVTLTEKCLAARAAQAKKQAGQ